MAAADKTHAAMVRPFTDFLADIGHGAVVDELTAAVATLVKQVQETGRKGSVTLKVTVGAYKGNRNTVDVQATTNVQLPPSDPWGGVFYPDGAGQLHRNDPNSPQLPYADVPAQERPVI